MGHPEGFNDPVEGAARRACVCSVLNYLDGVLAMHPDITTTNRLIIKFEAYQGIVAAPPSGTWYFPMPWHSSSMPWLLAAVTPNYPQGNPGGFHHSYMGNAVINGGTGLEAQHCGSIMVNWNHSYAYCSATIPACEVDFYSMILHEVTHILGFASALEKDDHPVTPVINLTLGTNTFTEFDHQFLYHENGGTLTKIVNNTTPGLAVSASTLVSSQNAVWINGDNLSTTRTNQPVVDRPNTNTWIAGTNFSYSHLHEEFRERTFRSPGFTPPYVMDYIRDPGVLRRTYSLQELRILVDLGFSINTTHPDYSRLFKRPPVTLGNVVDPSGSNAHVSQPIPAGNADLYITTDNCHSVTVDLGTNTISGWDPVAGAAVSHTLGLSDPDGDPMNIYQGQLWNIRGCGNGGNNHNQLVYNGNDQVSFTPRANFTGRAQFGFHVGDDHERGSFIVVTIDVTKNSSCFSKPDLCDLVVNGGYEEGSEYNFYDAATSSYHMKTEVDNTNFMGNYLYDWFVSSSSGQIFSDGLEVVLSNSTFGGTDIRTTIVDTYMPFYCWGPLSSYHTAPTSGAHPRWAWNSGPTGNTFPAPAPAPKPNRRYEYTRKQSNGAGQEHSMTLHSSPLIGAQYELQFSYHASDYLAGTVVNASPFAGRSMQIFLTNNPFTGLISYTSVPSSMMPLSNPLSWANSGWQRYSGTFTCSVGFSPYMRIVYGGGIPSFSNNGDILLIDSVSLHRIVNPTITAASSIVPTTLTASVPGGGIVHWQWYDAGGNPIPGATAPTLSVTQYGSYTIEATDSNGCTGSFTYGHNDPCPAFTAAVGGFGNILGTLTGTLSASPAVGGAYYVDGALTVNSSIAFDNLSLLMRPGSSITIDNNAQLDIINQSHLATCPGSSEMWQGIQLVGDWPRINVTGNSLIEDADAAILVDGLPSVSSTIHTVFTDGAIFNGNTKGIELRNITVQNNNYRFVNTIFTSRNLPASFVSWPSVVALKALGTSGAMPPYVLNTTYTIRDCHNGNPARAGIYLDHAGQAIVAPGSASGYTFNGVTIGDESSESLRNLFDYMGAGIEGHSSNLYVRNSSFTSMRPMSGFPNGSLGSVGVYADAALPQRTEAVVITSNVNIPANKFYENIRAVEMYDNYNSIVSRAEITSSNAAGDPSNPVGQFGMILKSAKYYDIYSDYNTISNMGTAVYVHRRSGANDQSGRIFVQGNAISLPLASSLGLAATYNNNVGIVLGNDLNCSVCPPATCFGCLPPPPVPYISIVRDNTLANVYNGVRATNFGKYIPVEIAYNTVSLQQAVSGLHQHGIRLETGTAGGVSENSVSSSANDNDNARAYSVSMSASPQLQCNTASTIGRGFEFSGTNVACGWLENTMQNNRKGFVLDRALIGPQGGPSFFGSLESENKWLGSWTGTSAYQTLTISSNPLNSVLYVNYSWPVTSTPTNNSGTPTFWAYGPGTGLQPATTYNAAQCGIPPGSGGVVWFRMHHAAAQDSVVYGYEEDRNRWISQLQAYRSALADSARLDSSAILQSFVATAAGSRYHWLTQIEDALTAGNDDLAADLLGSPVSGVNGVSGPDNVVIYDGPAGDSIVGNYVLFYELYLKTRDSSFDAADSLMLVALSEKCPLTDGAIIYQARVLRSHLTNTFPLYSDDCGTYEEESEGSGAQARRYRTGTAAVQGYSLSPNPTGGAAWLHQAINDDEPVQLKVYNSLGAVVYSSVQRFSDGQLPFDFGAYAPGMYSVVAQDSAGGIYTLKLVKK